jgi:hypothetical protein
MKRTWRVGTDALGYLPRHDEASLVALIAHAANALAPGFDVALVRQPLRNDYSPTSAGAYTMTNEVLHGERPAVRWLEVAEWTTDAEGTTSNDATHAVVTAEGLPPGARLSLAVDVRPQPLPDANLRVEAVIDADDESRIASAAALLDQCFGAPQEH